MTHPPHEKDPFAGVLDEDWPNKATEVATMPNIPDAPSTDRVDQFERIVDTIDEQRANQTLDEWIELLQKVKAEVDTRLASAMRWKKTP